MDMQHDVMTMDDAGVETMWNQCLQYAKCINLMWLKCYLIYLMNEVTGDLSVDELNDMEKASFNCFSGSFSEMPKLAMTLTPNPNHPIPAASSPAARFQKSIKHETTQYPCLLF